MSGQGEPVRRTARAANSTPALPITSFREQTRGAHIDIVATALAEQYKTEEIGGQGHYVD